MTDPPNAAPVLRCSFCNKSQAEVQKVIAGHRGVAICDECVVVCNDILADEGRPSSSDEYERIAWDESAPTDEPRLLSFKCPDCGHRWRIATRR